MSSYFDVQNIYIPVLTTYRIPFLIGRTMYIVHPIISTEYYIEVIKTTTNNWTWGKAKWMSSL